MKGSRKNGLLPSVTLAAVGGITLIGRWRWRRWWWS
jgi:hypothetical protein